jgi:hypothetical protein
VTSTLGAVDSAREFVRDAGDLFVTAGRLLLRHWPVLISLALAGMAFRGAALWAAVEVSDQVNWLGHGLVVLAPLGCCAYCTATCRTPIGSCRAPRLPMRRPDANAA